MNKVSTGILKVSLLIGLTAGYATAQGSLTPPGAPSPTMKTLEQVEPRIDLATVAGDATYHHVIAKQGSYYMSSNLEVTKANGIYIDSPGVTLDLNGFMISRTSGSGGDGIELTSNAEGCTVRNGSIARFTYGINSFSAKGGLYEKLAVSGCTYYGLRLGVSSRIINCHLYDNQGNYGIYAQSGSSIEDCIVTDNNVGWGISMSGGTVINCVANDNTGSGSNTGGISALDSVVIGCSAQGNSNTNSPGTSSQGIGIKALAGLVKDCRTHGNQGDGIQVTYGCIVSGNRSSNNTGGAGIHATLHSNRIDSNLIYGNYRGILVDSSDNYIVRNTARSNTSNYDIAGGNDFGTVQTTPVGAGAWDNF